MLLTHPLCVSICPQSEVEVEDATMDLLLGPADERDTNTRHTVNAEEELILRWGPHL